MEVFSLWRKLRRLAWKIAVGVICIALVSYAHSRLTSQGNRIQFQTSATANSSVESATPLNLRVVTYNIAHGRGCTDVNFNGETGAVRRQRLDSIATLLSQIDADIVILNEVDFDASWSGHVDQASYLAERAGYGYIVKQRNLDFRILGWTWCFGNAVLSKQPIATANEIDLPGFNAWETALAGKKRGVNLVVSLSPTQKVRVLATHLSPRSEALRVESAQKLIGLTKRSRYPTILAGDLNSFQRPQPSEEAAISSAIEVLNSSNLFHRHSLSGVEAEFTFPADAPNRSIDWVFVTKDATLANHRVIDSELSDHRPVVANIVFPSQSAPKPE